ncbi:MAG: cell division control protein Cdc6 [Candidatus Methanomethylicota archaeon]|uniref:ORC1-type DNA replication protein n=1 Tax=Thermoproteota archaeon TaxID=2056631 RepID=A0A497EQY6_9CREN|nr:MAG: cell division control protein Cdc6 [Candidatus Verstraetearchaeota archaeon]
MAGVSLDELFSRVLRARIFQNREILRPDYIPDSLPHRERQVFKLASVLAPAIKGARPSNVFIYGVTGSGKTAVTKYVLKRLGEESGKLGFSVGFAYVNCKYNDTNYRVIAELCETLRASIPFTGLSTAEAYRRFVRALDEHGSTFFVVLDEVDALVKKSGDETLYKLTRINTELCRSRVAVVGITNDLKFTEYLDARVRSSLGEEELIFPPYNAAELEDILKDRAAKAFYPGVLDQGVIPLCAALAAKEHGDARRALDLLRVAGEIAEREESDQVLEEHVKKAQREIERDRVVEVLKTMPLHSRLLVLSLHLLRKKDVGKVATGEVYNIYCELSRRLGLEPLTQRRVSDLLSELDMLGIINAKVVSKGRYGRTRIVSLNVSERNIFDAFSDDERLLGMLT